jgi:predicted nucleotidyltransferase
MLSNSIEIMTNSIINILNDKHPSIYIFGSVALDDFKLGWSDIDILCLTQETITDDQMNELVTLRQSLLDKHKDNKYFRSFEGGILTFDSFINKTREKAVYWGTSGQRITDSYTFDSFSMYELISDGVLLYGKDIRDTLTIPSYDELRKAVIHHYKAIRKYAVVTDRSIYSVGWLLDIARCIYTLRTGKVIAKTKAGEWALENKLCPVKRTLEKALEVRNQPLNYINEDKFWIWTETLGNDIQKFADVLQNEIEILL